MKEWLSFFVSYPQDHPLRELAEKGFDSNLNPRISEGTAAFNTLQPVFMVLQRVNMYSPIAVQSFVSDKLAARKGKDDYDAHNFISALCELSVINAFISASERPETFQYEPRLVEGSKKNVEFSIVVGGLLYEVEVKSANMIKEAKALEQEMEKEGQTIEPNARMLPPDEWKNIAGDTPIMWSLDNKVKDFLKDTQGKFPPVDKSIHLLFICWDGRYRKALTSLKSETSGLLTANTYEPELRYDHISHIVVSSQYGFLINWLQGLLPTLYNHDPVNLRFSYNFLIDYNLDKPTDIQKRLMGIFGCAELPIVDEAFVDKNCEAVAFTINL